ncbi:MAG: acetolactate synthase large subunit, partial [Planctomycetes bacterium]|nr:acetolactate synthase large subunit [Planctomycetota bacterium]
AEILNAASRPLLLLGGGVVIGNASDLARQLAARADLPVASTLMGLGAYPGRDSRHLGMLGMHGTVVANRAVTACDTLVAVGVRFDDRVTGKIAGFAPQARIVHIDVDPTSVSKNVPVDTPIVGDARLILEDLLPRVAAPGAGARAAWWQQIDAWKAGFPLRYGKGGLKPQYVIEELARQTAGQETTIATDVGQHQMWTALYYPFDRPRSLVTSGGLGTMGFGLPAGLGAQLAAPGRLTVVVTGDGGFQMNIQELATAKRLDLPVKILLLDNGCLGMVRQLQEMFFEKRYVYTDLSDNPDFVAVAAAYGIPAERCERAEDVPGAIARLLAAPGPAFLDVRIDREENVVPMVPSGAAIDQAIGARD